MLSRDRRVVVTGIGIVSPIGLGVKQFWANCLSAKSNIQAIPESWSNYYQPNSKIWSPLPDINFENEGIDKIEQMQMDQGQVLALIAAKQALEDANLGFKVKDKKKKTYELDNNMSENFGVYIGTGNGGINSMVDALSHHVLSPVENTLNTIYSEMNNNGGTNGSASVKSAIDSIVAPQRFNRFAVAMTMPNACSAKIGIKYSLTGPNNTYCSACASGTVAVGNAYKAIKYGEVDKAMTGGVEFLGEDYGVVFRGFDIAKTLVQDCGDPEKANRPFDQNRSGFLFSEGGGSVLILEELDHALNRNARIYAEITGYSATFDAYNIMMIEPDGKEIKKMISQLLNQANAKPEEIDYINAHGTGTMSNDVIESQVIESTFRKDVLVNSTKSIIGHTLGASGAIEASVTALSIKNKTTHINKNLEKPVNDLNYVRVVDDFKIRKAISQSFAFGGHNSALLFEEFKN